MLVYDGKLISPSRKGKSFPYLVCFGFLVPLDFSDCGMYNFENVKCLSSLPHFIVIAFLSLGKLL